MLAFMPKPIRVLAYLRVSTKSQLDGDGFIRQRSAIDNYVTDNNLQVVEYYEEQVSGTIDWTNRPAWCLMMDRIHPLGITTIVIERLDRLARELFVQEYILRDLRKHGITLLTTASEDTGESDPTRVLIRQILGAVAQYDRTMIIRRMKVAKDRIRAATGRCEGPLPYGSTPYEAGNVEYMRQLRDNGLSYTAIAVALKQNDIPTRNNKKWYGRTVYNVLNQSHTGNEKKFTETVK